MEPKKDPAPKPNSRPAPRPALFLGMTALYFGLYFSLKYVFFGGRLPPLANAALIGACLLAAIALQTYVNRKRP